MTEKETRDRIEGIFAYDFGALSSGIKDDEFKARIVKREIDPEPHLTQIARRMLNTEGYGLEDVKNLIDWADRELDYSF